MAVTARDAANTIENIKAPQNLTNKIIGRAAGSALGYGTLGVPGAIMGAYGGAEAVSRLQQAFGDLNLSNDIMARYAEKANTQQIDALKNAADDLIAKNNSAGVKMAAEQKIRDLIARALPAPAEGTPRTSFPSGPTIQANPAGGATIEPIGPNTLAGKYNAASGPKSNSLTPSKLRDVMERNASSEPYTPNNKLPVINLPGEGAPSRPNLPTAKGSPKVYAPQNFREYEPYTPPNKLPR